MIFTFNCDITNSNNEDNDTGIVFPAKTEAFILTYNIVINGTEYPMDTRGAVEGDLPYKTNMTQLIGTFTLSEGAKLYRGEIEQISGVTVNDFSSYFEYRVVSQDGKVENIYPVDIQVLKNTEAKLYSMSVLVGSTEYPCTIGSSTITVDFPGLYRADISNVILNFVISEDATLEKDGFPKTSGVTPTNLSDYSNVTIKVTAQSTSYSSTYNMIITCINCSK